MISIKRNIQNLLKASISQAFPIQADPTIYEITDRGDIYNYDYFSDAPKQIFDTHKTQFRMRNICYGLINYKEVGDSLKDQIPRNEIVEKVQVNQNGTLKFRIRSDYILKQLNRFPEFVTKSQDNQVLICLPAIFPNENIGYDYFRGLNKAEMLSEILKAFSYKTKFVLPYLINSTENANSSDCIPKEYTSLFQNKLFHLNPSLISIKKIITKHNITEELYKEVKIKTLYIML